MTNWGEIKDGYGLQPLPVLIEKRTVCCMCARVTKCKLYTDQRLPDSTNPEKYRQEVEALIAGQRIWCKDHAIYFFSGD